MSSLNILQNSATTLIAEQSPPGGGFFMIVSMLVALGVGVFAFTQRRWVLGLLMFGLSAVFLLFLLPGVAYRIELNREAHTIAWEQVRSGKAISRQQVDAGSIQSADMDFNRNARNIILLGRDGTQYYPLGRQHFTGEPEQAVVLTAVREMIGAAPGSSTPSH